MCFSLAPRASPADFHPMNRDQSNFVATQNLFLCFSNSKVNDFRVYQTLSYGYISLDIQIVLLKNLWSYSIILIERYDIKIFKSINTRINLLFRYSGILFAWLSITNTTTCVGNLVFFWHVSWSFILSTGKNDVFFHWYFSHWVTKNWG